MNEVPFYTHVAKNINGKFLYEEIITSINSILDTTVGLDWASAQHRFALQELFSEYLSMLHERGKIDRWQVICDQRNNISQENKKGLYRLTITYVHHNCFNATEIRYVISNNIDIFFP